MLIFFIEAQQWDKLSRFDDISALTTAVAGLQSNGNIHGKPLNAIRYASHILTLWWITAFITPRREVHSRFFLIPLLGLACGKIKCLSSFKPWSRMMATKQGIQLQMCIDESSSYAINVRLLATSSQISGMESMSTLQPSWVRLYSHPLCEQTNDIAHTGNRLGCVNTCYLLEVQCTPVWTLQDFGRMMITWTQWKVQVIWALLPPTQQLPNT
jgi:hypothetical protein